MNIKTLIALIPFCLFTLTGCNQAKSLGEWSVEDNGRFESPTIVLNPGYKIMVDGRDIPIQGFDECSSHDERIKSCVRLSKDRSVVSVMLFPHSTPILEEWKIIRETGKSKNGGTYMHTRLSRPDGSLVIPAI